MQQSMLHFFAIDKISFVERSEGNTVAATKQGNSTNLSKRYGSWRFLKACSSEYGTAIPQGQDTSFLRMKE